MSRGMKWKVITACVSFAASVVAIGCILVFMAVARLKRPAKLDSRAVAAVEARQAEIDREWKVIEAMVAPPEKVLAAIERHQLLVDTLPDEQLVESALRTENVKRNNHPFEIKDAREEGGFLVVDLFFPTVMFRPTHRAVLVRTDRPGYERFKVISFEMVTNDYLESDEGKMYARLNGDK